MREIKFRAFINPDEGSDWDDGKKMVYDLAFQQYEPINDLLAKVPTLMQYTGLKDKNGVEIYEGDILTYDYADNKEVKDWMVKAHFIVRYEKDYIIFGTDIKPERKCFLHGFRFKFTEVMGNIHEHPNLLTTTK